MQTNTNKKSKKAVTQTKDIEDLGGAKASKASKASNAKKGQGSKYHLGKGGEGGGKSSKNGLIFGFGIEIENKTSTVWTATVVAFAAVSAVAIYRKYRSKA